MAHRTLVHPLRYANQTEWSSCLGTRGRISPPLHLPLLAQMASGSHKKRIERAYESLGNTIYRPASPAVAVHPLCQLERPADRIGDQQPPRLRRQDARSRTGPTERTRRSIKSTQNGPASPSPGRSDLSPRIGLPLLKEVDASQAPASLSSRRSALLFLFFGRILRAGPAGK